MKDYYKILGVDNNASKDEIKKAYRKLSMKYHPDRQGGKSEAEQKEAEEKFKEIAEAYSVLSDPKKKQEWEMEGQSASFSGNPFDIFSSMFGAETQKGQSLRIVVNVTVFEAFKGTEKTIKYKRQVYCTRCGGKGAVSESDIKICTSCKGSGRTYKKIGPWQQVETCPECYGQGKTIVNPCPDCQGSGLKTIEETLELTIPKFHNSYQTVLQGKGCECLDGIPGDLFIVYNIIPEYLNFVLSADGRLFYYVDINVIDAILGIDVTIKDLENKSLKVSIKPGTRDGHILRLPQKGLYFNESSSTRDDLYIMIHHIMPNNLTDKQIKLLKQFKNDSN